VLRRGSRSDEMRVVFLAYLLLIAAGLAFAMVVGLGSH
jgi:hypothetical protein